MGLEDAESDLICMKVDSIEGFVVGTNGFF